MSGAKSLDSKAITESIAKKSNQDSYKQGLESKELQNLAQQNPKL
ncbi:hypothetical protein [uncultured Helicobacter sp.]